MNLRRRIRPGLPNRTLLKTPNTASPITAVRATTQAMRLNHQMPALARSLGIQAGLTAPEREVPTGAVAGDDVTRRWIEGRRLQEVEALAAIASDGDIDGGRRR